MKPSALTALTSPPYLPRNKELIPTITQTSKTWFCIVMTALWSMGSISAIEWSDDIETDTTWTASNSPYILTSTVDIGRDDGRPVTLTIEPGVEVRGNHWFNGVTYNWINIRVGKGGAIRALGSQGAKILFTTRNESKEAGRWPGILIEEEARGNDCRFEHCRFMYAGSSGAKAGVFVIEGVPEFSRCEFEENTVGIAVNPNSDTTAGAQVNNCLFNNNGTAIQLEDATNVTLHNNVFTSNVLSIEIDNTYPDMQGNEFGPGQEPSLLDFSTSGTLQVPGTSTTTGTTTPYVLREPVIIRNTNTPVTFTLEPGLTMAGEVTWNGTTFSWTSIEAHENASIHAQGTSEKPITFTTSSSDKEAGQWPGVELDNDSDADNSVFQHCIFEYGGGQVDGMLIIETGSPRIIGCVFQNGENGLVIEDDATPFVFKCRFLEQTKAGIQVRSLDQNITVQTCDFIGNMEYAVRNSNHGENWVDASSCYWGHASGPLDVSDADGLYNPNGQGDPVTDYVRYDSFATTSVAEPTPTVNVIKVTGPQNCDPTISFTVTLSIPEP